VGMPGDGETFVVKDSGKRQEFEGGMVRDVADDKTDYTLILDGPMFKRWAEHLTKGAQKYSPRNWMLASGKAEYLRFKASAFRHFLQWFWGDVDEDHAAAVFFNINGAEYTKAKLDETVKEINTEAAELIAQRDKAIEFEKTLQTYTQGIACAAWCCQPNGGNCADCGCKTAPGTSSWGGNA
jgi:hypothetical protein